MAELFYSTEFRDSDRDIVMYDGVEYIVSDRRLSEQLPAGGEYFPDDPKANQYTSPLPLAALTKFDRVEGVGRVFDSGNIVIYDVRGIRDAP